MPAPAFPALAPSSRTFTPGSYLQASYQSLDGRQTNVAHSNAMISSRLALQVQTRLRDALSLIHI